MGSYVRCWSCVELEQEYDRLEKENKQLTETRNIYYKSMECMYEFVISKITEEEKEKLDSGLKELASLLPESYVL